MADPDVAEVIAVLRGLDARGDEFIQQTVEWFASPRRASAPPSRSRTPDSSTFGVVSARRYGRRSTSGRMVASVGAAGSVGATQATTSASTHATASAADWLLAVEDTPDEDTPDEDAPSILRDVESPEMSELTDPATIFELIRDASLELIGDLLTRLPLIVLALIVLVILLVMVRLVVGGVKRGMVRAKVDFTVQRLVSNLLRIVLLITVVLFSLALAGVEVGAVLAALGLIGLGIALALQNILENLISGVMILLRKPYDRGEVIGTNDIEGFVEDIDLRVTTIRTFDGTLVLVPNADIFRAPLTNFTRRGTRRSEVQIGIDYRDDHVAAKDILLQATLSVEQVMEEPSPRVFLVELGDSSVDYVIRFWTTSDLLTGAQARDGVLTACKSSIEAAGMTIPWPIRTLAADMRPLQVEQRRPNDGGSPLPAVERDLER